VGRNREVFVALYYYLFYVDAGVLMHVHDNCIPKNVKQLTVHLEGTTMAIPIETAQAKQQL